MKKQPLSAPMMLAKQASQKRVPTTVTFQVTDRCNYDCSHCYQDHTASNELTTDAIFEILEQLADAGILFLTFMGGEFFMHPDADEILKKAHDLGFALKVLTTGHHVHDKRADFLASIRPIQIDMSIYGSRAELHEHVTQQAGSWQRTYTAAKRLIERKITVLLKTPLMQHNAADYQHLKALAGDIGAQFTCDPKITATETAEQAPVTLRMSSDALQHFYSKSLSGDATEAYIEAEKTALRALGNPTCGAGQGSCFINPRGEVWPCGSLPMPVGDLRKQDFLSIWTDSKDLQAIRDLRWADISECNECPVRSYCNRCHGMALMEQGNMKGPSLEACRHAVVVRDSLRNRGLLPDDHRGLPPTWGRVDANGQHDRTDHSAGRRRSLALRVLQ